MLNNLCIPPAGLEPAEATEEEEGRGCSLVNAGLGVRDLVEAGDFKPESVSPLPFVHVVAEGQDHLQQLLEAAALQHRLGAGADGCREKGEGHHLPRARSPRGQRAATSSLPPSRCISAISTRSSQQIGLLAFHLGLDFCNSLRKLLLEVEGLQPLLIMVYPTRGKQRCRLSFACSRWSSAAQLFTDGLTKHS